MIDRELRKEMRIFIDTKEKHLIRDVRVSYMKHIELLLSEKPKASSIPFPPTVRYDIVVDKGLHIPIWEGDITIDKIFLQGTYAIQDPIIFKTKVYATYKGYSKPAYLSMNPAYGVHFMFDGGTPTNFPQICLGDYNLDMKDTTTLKGLSDIGIEVAQLLSGVNLNSLGQKYTQGEAVNARGDLALLDLCEGSILWVEEMVNEGRIKKLL